MPSIYFIDFVQKSSDLNVPILRQTKFAAFLKLLTNQLTFLWNRFFIDYSTGAAYPLYNSLTTYNFGDFVRYGNINYLYINTAPSSGKNPTDTNYWYQQPGNFVGLDERLAMNSQKLKFEYALNRWFGLSLWSTVQWTGSTPPYTQIYIERTHNSNGNFWLSNGGAGSLTSYMGNLSIGTGQQAYLGDGYNYNPYSFTIWVPNAVLSALALPIGVSDATLVIKDFATKYTRAGKTFQVLGY